MRIWIDILCTVAIDVLISVRRTVFVEPGVKPPEQTIIKMSPAPKGLFDRKAPSGLENRGGNSQPGASPPAP